LIIIYNIRIYISINLVKSPAGTDI